MQLHKIELFLLQATISSCFKSSAVVDKAVDLAGTNYNRHFETTIVWCHDVEEITYFLQKFSGTVVLTAIRNNNEDEIRKSNERLKFKQTIFFAKSVQEFAYFLTLLKLVVPIHLILVLTKPTVDDEISAFTRMAWDNDLADIIIVSMNEESVVVSTYFPYKSGFCGDPSPVTIKLTENKRFPKKFSNFHGCPIRVTLLHLLPYSKLTFENNAVKYISGLDGNVFMILIEQLNASMDIVSSKDHGGVGTYINGTGTGSFGDLVERRADIFSPAVIINYLRYPVAQVSHVIETIDVYWFGPHRREIHEWMRVLQPLMTDISPALITSFILFIVVTKIVKRYGLHRVYFKHTVLFQSFVMFLGQEVKFESRSWLVNSLFVLWIWFCMVVRIVYQGDLIDGLQKTILEEPLSNLKEAVKVVDAYGGSEGFREFYRGTSFFKHFQILKIGAVRKQIEEITAGKRFLMAMDKLQAFEYSHGLQIIDEPITHAPLGFFMRPGWPAAKEVDAMIVRLIEAGFVQKVLKDYNHEWLKKEKQYNADREFQPLNMQSVLGCFYGFEVLCVLCFLVFFIEIIYYKLTRQTN